MQRLLASLTAIVVLAVLCTALPALAQPGLKKGVFDVGKLKPRDSQLKVKVGQMAPDFTLPTVGGGKLTLSSFRGKKNVVISFVPAAWTPICSDQWPGYNLASSVFAERDAILLGITVDNIPTLYSWTQAMSNGEGVWFPVLSDFWPHGAVAKKYGVLRSDGTTERALIVIDKKGVIRYIDVHDINERPDMGVLASELDKLK